jgi:deazaflavin-dependent oxidoreductase (nitroreductase family)
VVYRLSRGRTTFSTWISGLRVVMLTTTGARTGQQRTLPVIGLADGEALVVIASNFGRRHHPAWYHNLRAHPEVSFGGVAMHAAVVEDEAESERLWALAAQAFPPFARFRREAAAAQREVPIVQLTPR